MKAAHTWTPVGSVAHATMADARGALKKMEGGKWKWAKSPGNGVTHACFSCNAHVDCNRNLRIVLCDGCYHIQGRGDHALQPNLKRRVNSILTYDEEARVRESMDQGGKSAGLFVSLTNSKVKELKDAGKNPEEYKEVNGGLIGALFCECPCTMA